MWVSAPWTSRPLPTTSLRLPPPTGSLTSLISPDLYPSFLGMADHKNGGKLWVSIRTAVVLQGLVNNIKIKKSCLAVTINKKYRGAGMAWPWSMFQNKNQIQVKKSKDVEFNTINIDKLGLSCAKLSISRCQSSLVRLAPKTGYHLNKLEIGLNSVQLAGATLA